MALEVLAYRNLLKPHAKPKQKINIPREVHGRRVYTWQSLTYGGWSPTLQLLIIILLNNVIHQ